MNEEQEISSGSKLGTEDEDAHWGSVHSILHDAGGRYRRHAAPRGREKHGCSSREDVRIAESQWILCPYRRG